MFKKHKQMNIRTSLEKKIFSSITDLSDGFNEDVFKLEFLEELPELFFDDSTIDDCCPGVEVTMPESFKAMFISVVNF